jgi:hypothetical protein
MLDFKRLAFLRLSTHGRSARRGGAPSVPGFASGVSQVGRTRTSTIATRLGKVEPACEPSPVRAGGVSSFCAAAAVGCGFAAMLALPCGYVEAAVLALAGILR